MSTEIHLETVRAKIKQILSNVTGIAPDQLADDTAFVEDLNLDSLSLLEVGVDIDYEFKLGVPEERLQQLRTVQDAVDLVLERRGAGMPPTLLEVAVGV